MRSDIFKFVQEFIESHDAIGTKLETRFLFRKLYRHCTRCAHWARHLAVAEGADLDVAEIGALFHDIGKSVDTTPKGHAETGAIICDRYLTSLSFDLSKRHQIVDIVRHHTTHARDQGASIEARVVSDADLLDEFGAITVLWDAMAEGSVPDCSYDSAFERIAAQSVKICKSSLTQYHTEVAREIATRRRAFLSQFVDQLARELGRAERLESWDHVL